MTDIVDRLRRWNAWLVDYTATRILVGDAADEIERLRAALLDAARNFEMDGRPVPAEYFRRAANHSSGGRDGT